MTSSSTTSISSPAHTPTSMPTNTKIRPPSRSSSGNTPLEDNTQSSQDSKPFGNSSLTSRSPTNMKDSSSQLFPTSQLNILNGSSRISGGRLRSRPLKKEKSSSQENLSSLTRVPSVSFRYWKLPFSTCLALLLWLQLTPVEWSRQLPPRNASNSGFVVLKDPMADYLQVSMRSWEGSMVLRT